jgi:hypothetical protein
MIRVYKELLYLLAFLIAYLEEKGYTIYDVMLESTNLRTFRGRLHPNADISYVIYKAVTGISNSQIGDLKGILHSTLADEINGESVDYGGLINELVRVTSMPLGRATAQRGWWGAMRAALMVPSELRAFKESLKDKLRCKVCARKISDGEMMSFINDGEDVDLYCVNCSKPCIRACSFCPTGVVQLKWGERMKRHVSCGCRKPDGTPVDQTVTADEMRNALNRNVVNGPLFTGRGGRAAGGVFRVTPAPATLQPPVFGGGAQIDIPGTPTPADPQVTGWTTADQFIVGDGGAVTLGNATPPPRRDWVIMPGGGNDR